MGPGDPGHLCQPGVYLKTVLPLRQFRKTVQKTFRVPALRVRGSCRCECRVQYCCSLPAQRFRGVPGTRGTRTGPHREKRVATADPYSAVFFAAGTGCRKFHQLREPSCSAGILLSHEGPPHSLIGGGSEEPIRVLRNRLIERSGMRREEELSRVLRPHESKSLLLFEGLPGLLMFQV